MAKSKISAAEKDAMISVGQEIINRVKEDVFEIEGSPTATVKNVNGSFRKKALFGGWEFFLTDCYIGVRDSLIFIMTPVDKQEFETIECSIKEADDFFPLMGSQIAARFDLTDERMPTVFDKIGASIEKAKKDIEQEALKAYSNNPQFGMF